MNKIVLKIDGMKCGMCESHVNDVIRRAANVKSVSSSHSKGQTVILAEDDIDEQVLKDAIAQQGYRVTAVEKSPYEKKGFFSRFKK